MLNAPLPFLDQPISAPSVAEKKLNPSGFSLGENQGFDRALQQAQKIDQPAQKDINANDDAPQDPLRDEVRKLLSTAFITPLFSELRKGTGFAEGTPFAPGFAEKGFQQMFDQIISDRIIEQMDENAGGMSLVNKLTEHLGKNAYSRASALEAKQSPSIDQPVSTPNALDQHV